jgi:hypothetical protein
MSQENTAVVRALNRVAEVGKLLLEAKADPPIGSGNAALINGKPHTSSDSFRPTPHERESEPDVLGFHGVAQVGERIKLAR